jgi:hypothetical protein
LLKRMRDGKPVYYDHNDAFAVAREAVAKK